MMTTEDEITAEDQKPVVSFLIRILTQCTEVRFASLLSGGFTTMELINPPGKKLANHTSVQWGQKLF